MSVGAALLLGAVQGLTEFLPVSSSGHLVIIQSLMGSGTGEGYLFFDLLLHFGTLIAVAAAFWQDIKKLVCEFFAWVGDGFKVRNKPERRFIIMILLSLLPMFAVLPFKDYVERLFCAPTVVGFSLLVTAALLYICDGCPNGTKTEADAKYSDALAVGAMQCAAVIPGISRSGATVCGGVMRGFSREFAVKFAFIMSIPVILGANILSAAEAFAERQVELAALPSYIAGVAAAAVSGYFAIRLIKYLAAKKSFAIFSVYCAVIGAIVIISNMF